VCLILGGPGPRLLLHLPARTERSRPQPTGRRAKWPVFLNSRRPLAALSCSTNVRRKVEPWSPFLHLWYWSFHKVWRLLILQAGMTAARALLQMVERTSTVPLHVLCGERSNGGFQQITTPLPKDSSYTFRRLFAMRMDATPWTQLIERTICLVVSVCCGRIPSHMQQASPVTDGAITLTSYHDNTISIL
jgi:hypothetical protein